MNERAGAGPGAGTGTGAGSGAPLVIRPEDPDSAVARALVDAVQEEYRHRYGGPDETPVDPASFAPPSGVFAVGWVDGRPVASGALRRRDDVTAEIKRMYSAPEVRRRGVGAAMLRCLEDAAERFGYLRLVLETGDEQPEALAMYRSAGYEPVEPYGYYRCHPDAHALGRTLGGGSSSR